MKFQELSHIKSQIKNSLLQVPFINKSRVDFMISVFHLFLGIKGRINFLQLERFGKLDEQTFRNQFNNKMDFMSFNLELISKHASNELVIAFDPSYLNKSGKKTPGVGWFWSGCASSVKWGIEICGIAAVDLENQTAFHLESIQTIDVKTEETLLTHYSKMLIERKESLRKISRYVVVDAYFSKQSFISPMVEQDFEIVTRLRDDADLSYQFSGEQKKGRGRPRKYGKKVIFTILDPENFKQVDIEEILDNNVFQGIVYSKSLKRLINCVVIYTTKNGKTTHKIYMSTELELSAEKLMKYYRSRFQIEFLFRDAKQHTGLNDCQARSKEKIDFHTNTSLTTVNLAKAFHWLNQPNSKSTPFSMANVKTMYHNKLMLDLFLCKFNIKPNTKKNRKLVDELLDYGKIAA